jgi:hypothetical protein
MPDTIQISILEDGTIKVETDKISGPNHLNATQFLAEMSRLAGGKTEVKQKTAKAVVTQPAQVRLNQ